MPSQGNTKALPVTWAVLPHRLAGRNGLLVLFWRVRDAAAADAALQQLVSLWLLLTGFTGSVRCSAGRVAEFAHHAAQADGGVAIYGVGEAGLSWHACVWLETTGLFSSRR